MAEVDSGEQRDGDLVVEEDNERSGNGVALVGMRFL